MVNMQPAADGERIILRFDGVDSYAEIHVNGTYVGMTKGSRLSANSRDRCGACGVEPVRGHGAAVFGWYLS